PLIPSQPPGGKPPRAFPGVALLFRRTPRAENRRALFLGLLFIPPQPPGGKPLRTFPGVALLFRRNPRAENRCALFLGLLKPPSPSSCGADGRPRSRSSAYPRHARAT